MTVDCISPKLTPKDPDCHLIRASRLKQPDYCLQYTVRFERDVIGQMEALNQLVDYPVEQTIKDSF